MQWKANYHDGTHLMQYDGDKENSYEDIQRDKLKSFSILGDNDKVILSVYMERPTQRLIHRRRIAMRFDGSKKVCWLVGWHENIGGKSIKSICYILPDGTIEMAGARDDIVLMEQEM